MSLFDVAGAITGVLNGAQELVIDVVTVNQVRTLLDDAIAELVLAQQNMPSIPASAVGGSFWGSQLSHHSMLAHDRLLETITELRSGLDNYEKAMQVVLNNTFGADDDNTSVLKRGDSYVGDATTNHGNG